MKVTTRWLTENDLFDAFLYFKDQVIEVYKPFQTLSSTEIKRIGIPSTNKNGWPYSKVLHGVLRIFFGPTKGLQVSTYMTLHATIPSVHLLLKKLDEINTQNLRLNYLNTPKPLPLPMISSTSTVPFTTRITVG